VTTYTVLCDAGCSLCSRFRDWLVRQPTLVPLELVPAASDEARRRFPTLDRARSTTHARSTLASRAGDRLARLTRLPVVRGSSTTWSS
jgi:predicted DCC family thiol-disulfide oxidoreductase YuxK